MKINVNDFLCGLIQKNLLFVILIVIQFQLRPTCARDFSLSINGGLSDGSTIASLWKPGYVGGANLYLNPDRTLSFGIRLAFNKWTIDGYGWTKEYIDYNSKSFSPETAKGSQIFVEIIPALRIKLYDKIQVIKFFIHCGAGFFVSYIDGVFVWAHTINYDEWQGDHVNNYFDESVGVQLGPSITFAGRIEVSYLYNMYLDDDWYNFSTANIGFIFQF